MSILIAGGGIGGLSCAVALAEKGHETHILEQAESFSEVGAGIQIGPNGMRILHHWGLREILRNKGARPLQIRISDGWSGRLLNRVPLGEVAERRYGAPYKVFHRAELQEALLQKAQSLPQITISTGFRVDRFDQHDDHIIVQGANGKQEHGRLLIGADGVWSNIRTQIHPHIKPTFYGKSAWRTIVPRESAPSPFNRLETGLWMAPDAHLVHYPVKGGESINIVAVISEQLDSKSWSNPGQASDLLRHFTDWHESPRYFLQTAKGWQKWPLYDLSAIPHWREGRVCLLGDAAHPPIPFLAQGGVMAIEDSFVLAEQLAQYGEDHVSAFAAYEKQRRARAYRVMDTAHKLGKIYHMKGLMRLARNGVLTAKKPEKLLASYDWLYGFDVTAAS